MTRHRHGRWGNLQQSVLLTVLVLPIVYILISWPLINNIPIFSDTKLQTTTSQQPHIYHPTKSQCNVILHVGLTYDVTAKYIRNYIDLDKVFLSKDGYSVTLEEEDAIHSNDDVPDIIVSKGHKRNVLFSSYRLNDPNLNLFHLSSLLQQPVKDVSVFLTYRRFGELLPSIYARMYGNHKKSTKWDQYPSLVDWLSMERVNEWFQNNSTVVVAERYSRYFDNVFMFNLEETSKINFRKSRVEWTDVMQSLYCDIMSREGSACLVQMDRIGRNEHFAFFPPDENLDNDRLVRAAYHSGLLNNDVDKEWVVSAVQYAKKSLPGFDFPETCVSSRVRKQLANLTLVEKEILFNVELTRKEKKKKLSILKKKYKYCNAHVKLILKEKKWRDFFSSLMKKALEKPVINAVIHVGPNKMASTTIQKNLEDDVEYFQMDKYFVHPPPAHLFGFCLGGQMRDCVMKNFPTHLRSFIAENLHKNHTHQLISAESLSRSGVDVELLSDIFQPLLNVTIIVLYRRFYEWVPSFFYQRHRYKPTLKSYDLVEYLQPERIEGDYVTRHTLGTVERYRKHFSNVVVVNMHDKSHGDLISTIYCHYIPGARNACAYRKQKSENLTPMKKNKSESLDYNRLVKAAAKESLLRKINPINYVKVLKLESLVKDRQENQLKLTHLDFPQTCVSPEVRNMILEKSLATEKALFPEWFASPSGEADLRKGFQEESKTKLCNADTTKVLQNKGWRDFFLSLTQSDVDKVYWNCTTNMISFRCL